MMWKEIRFEYDKKYFKELKENSIVQKTMKMIENFEEKNAYLATRKHLLSSSVRLTPAIFPTMGPIVDECVEKLNLDLPLELFVYSSPQFNAACFKPEAGKLYIMFSSALLEAFDKDELKFVLGHEIGHYIYSHHDIPLNLILKNKVSSDLALKLFTWSRYAEISADRAGAYCAHNLESVGRSLFKLSSGVSKSNFIKFNFEAFLNQIDELKEISVPTKEYASDWFTTHPFSPLRLKALKFFQESSLMQEGGKSKNELENLVKSAMGIMEPDYLLGKNGDAVIMRDFFIVSALKIIDSDGQRNKEERDSFHAFLNHSVDLEKINPEALLSTYDTRLKKLNDHLGAAQKIQVLRDLVVIMQADQKISLIEKKVFREICLSCEIDPSLIDRSVSIVHLD